MAGLNEARPDVLVAYPSALHVLSFQARAGRLRIAPRQVLTTAEPLLPEIRAAGEAAWGVRAGNIYSSSEGGGIAVPCDRSESHLSEDLLMVEPVDDQGRSVAPGQRSAKVYLTNLYNRTLPLIRYELTDEVTILPESCRCGSAYRCVADVQGRLNEVFSYGKRRIHPHVFRTALARYPGVAEYQVRQAVRGARIAVRRARWVDLDGLSREIVQALARLGLPGQDVQVQAVARVRRGPGPAKLKRFVPLGSELEPALAEPPW